MADIRKCRLIIPAVNLSDGVTCVFRTPHLPTERLEYNWKISDIILAATAAPTFFPHKNLPDGKAYVDGALWANDPGVVAMSEAARVLRCKDGTCSSASNGLAFDSSQIHMLAIGTGQVNHSLSPPGTEAGMLFWARHVAELMNLLQVQGSQFPLKVVMGDRYRQFDFEIEDKTWTLDNIEMMDQLFELGRKHAEEQFDSLAGFFTTKTSAYELRGQK